MRGAYSVEFKEKGDERELQRCGRGSTEGMRTTEYVAHESVNGFLQ
jgi:hypothetical protein